MILTSSVRHALAIKGAPIYIAAPGSNVPHSVCLDGRIEELIDPPILPISAEHQPRFL